MQDDWNWNPTKEELIAWAYSDELAEQDWDLFITIEENFDMIFMLANDPLCNHQYFFLSCLYFIVGNGVRSNWWDYPKQSVEELIEKAALSSTEMVRQWAEESRNLLKTPRSFNYRLWCEGGLALKNYRMHQNSNMPDNDMSDDELSPLSVSEIWPPPPDIPGAVICSNSAVPWQRFFNVIGNVAIGGAFGLVLSTAISGVLWLLLPRTRMTYLLYLIHTPLYYFVVRQISKSIAFRYAFAVSCLLVVGAMAWFMWMTGDFVDYVDY